MKKYGMLLVVSCMIFCLLGSNTEATVNLDSFFADTTFLQGYVFLSPSADIAVINGKEVPGISPKLVNNLTLVPVRFVVEAFNGKVDWNEAKKLVTITIQEKSIQMTLGKKSIFINGKEKKIDIAPQEFNNTIYLPLRVLGDSIDKITVYNEPTDLIIIRDPKLESLEYNNSTLKDIKWLLQDQPIIYSDDSFLFLDRPDGLCVFDKSSNRDAKVSSTDSFVGEKLTVADTDYFLCFSSEPTMGSPCLYAVKGKKIKLLMAGDITDFKIYKGNLYIITNESRNYFAEDGSAPYKGNLYTIALKNANNNWDELKHMGKVGYMYGLHLTFAYADAAHKSLYIYQGFGVPDWEITPEGIVTRGVDALSGSPEKTLGYYLIPFDGSEPVKIRNLTEKEYPEIIG